jgi:hypothetical protein
LIRSTRPPPLTLRANVEFRSRISNNEQWYACGVSIYIINGAKRLLPSIFEILFLIAAGRLPSKLGSYPASWVPTQQAWVSLPRDAYLSNLQTAHLPPLKRGDRGGFKKCGAQRLIPSIFDFDIRYSLLYRGGTPIQHTMAFLKEIIHSPRIAADPRSLLQPQTLSDRVADRFKSRTGGPSDHLHSLCLSCFETVP